MAQEVEAQKEKGTRVCSSQVGQAVAHEFTYVSLLSQDFSLRPNQPYPCCTQARGNTSF